MANRTVPFNMRSIIVLYNLIAVIVNAYVVALAVETLTLKPYRIYCQRVMHSKEDLPLAKAVWWYYISKAFEFWDTWFFILNKKFSHISILHVYHHATMFPIWYLATFVLISSIKNDSSLPLFVDAIHLAVKWHYP